jgi:hypothetical protein
MAPIKPTTAPIKPRMAPIKLTCHSHFTSSKGVLLDISLVASSGNASMLHLPQQACSKGRAAFNHTPRPNQLKAAKSIYANPLAHTGTLTYANALAQTDSLKGFPIRWVHNTFLHTKSLTLGFSRLDFPFFFLPAQRCHHKRQLSGPHRFPHGFPFNFFLHYWFNIYVVATRVCRSPGIWRRTDCILPASHSCLLNLCLTLKLMIRLITNYETVYLSNG